MSVAVALTAMKLAAEFAPDIIGLFSKGKGAKAEEIANTVEGIAEALTGKSGDEALEAIKASPELALKFKQAVMADAHVQDEMAYADRANAREAYKLHHEATDKTADRIMLWNLPAIGILASINIGSVYFLKDEAGLAATITGVLVTIINHLLNERQQVCGFRFGSSMGSKMKSLPRK